MVNIFLDIDDFRLLIRETAWLEGKHNSGVFVPYRLEISGEHFITSDLYNTLVDSVIRCADEIAHKRYTSQPILEWSISPVSIEG